MSEAIKYRGFLIDLDVKEIYFAHNSLMAVFDSPVTYDVAGFKKKIDEFCDNLTANGFTCPPKPRVRKVEWLSLPADCGYWDKGVTEEDILAAEIIEPNKRESCVVNGVPVYYHIIEVYE